MSVKNGRVRIERLATGVPGLDEVLGGGLREGDAALIAGPSGTGKTLFVTQFIAEGARRGEPGVSAVFEEHPLTIGGSSRVSPSEERRAGGFTPA